MTKCKFNDFFKIATGFKPFPYQEKIANKEDFCELIKIPTGAGKTASVVISWLWKRKFSGQEDVPRRLVYCLPMRVLVEQTISEIKSWIENLSKEYTEFIDEPTEVYTLMGGELDEDWDRYPEKESILVGTQDMLLSRALNRGYALSRFRWPIDFGLLNNDSLWVMDEIQLMGAGLPNSAQLESFRDNLGGIRHSTVWMSATCEPEWLETVDRDPPENDSVIELTKSDRGDEIISKRLEASKDLKISELTRTSTSKSNTEEYLKSIRDEILDIHDGFSLVILNTVNRACELHKYIREKVPDKSSLVEDINNLEEKINDLDSWAKRKKDGDLYSRDETKLEKYKEELQKKRELLEGEIPEIILLHSRFRPKERKALNEKIKSLKDGDLPDGGAIIISTQVIEAGVDISAKNMFTELAPWPSLVQRFGRLNRYGESKNSSATVFNISTSCSKSEELALPYTPEELENAKTILDELSDVSIESIESTKVSLPNEQHMVLRKNDIIDLFDTTPDLSGNDIDVSQYIRDVKNRDVYVFWRDFDTEDMSVINFPSREEICSVPLNSMKKFLDKNDAYIWDHLSGDWANAYANDLVPGQYILIHTDQGGYTKNYGWDQKSGEKVEPINQVDNVSSESTSNDLYVSTRHWQTLNEHTEKTMEELKEQVSGLPLNPDAKETLLSAARFHDVGKAHPVFQDSIKNLDGCPSDEIWSKSGSKNVLRYGRKYFRHELASALILLQNPEVVNVDAALISYLVAAHHGKVRLSIRSLPEEDLPWEKGSRPEGTRFARGIWEGDKIPPLELPGGVSLPSTRIDLSPMNMGLNEDGKLPWIEMMSRLRDEYGIFKLGYMESILRTADWKASSDGGE